MGKKFNKLEHHIEQFYESKGISEKEAEYIGKATAGKTAREKKAHR